MPNLKANPSEPPDLNPLYDRFIAQLRMQDVGGNAPKVGEAFAPFAIPNSQGRYVDFQERYGGSPVVLSFMRGGWCPYCRSELAAWHRAIPRLEAAGGLFVAVSGEVGGRAETTRCELAPASEMLCDVDHGLAMAMGLTHLISPELHRRWAELGVDLAEIYGDSGWLLPIPATFVVGPDGVVRYAFVEPDFRIRPDTAEIVAVVESLN